MPRVVTLGGGYAGLACLIELSKRDSKLELHLVDAQPEHCKITNLHKTLARPPADFTVPYASLAERFDFRFHHQRLAFTAEDLASWQDNQAIALAGTDLAFDWLVVCTGARPQRIATGQNSLTQNDLRHGKARVRLEALLEAHETGLQQVSLVGGGATGVQILFELHDLLRKHKVPEKIRLIDLNDRLTPDLPAGVHDYIVKKLQREGIEYFPATRYLGHDHQQIHLEETAAGRKFSLPSDLALLFPGVSAPLSLQTNPFGQVMIAEQVLPAIFSAGDCSHFNSGGLNALTAQAAVRKGKLVANNILALHQGKSLQEYRYREKGYLISLGTTDAVGWVGLRCNLSRGLPALLLKEAMETQYDLFLKGVDTYFGFP
jgi:NADH dehydrogenase